MPQMIEKSISGPAMWLKKELWLFPFSIFALSHVRDFSLLHAIFLIYRLSQFVPLRDSLQGTVLQTLRLISWTRFLHFSYLVSRLSREYSPHRDTRGPRHLCSGFSSPRACGSRSRGHGVDGRKPALAKFFWFHCLGFGAEAENAADEFVPVAGR